MKCLRTACLNVADAMFLALLFTVACSSWDECFIHVHMYRLKVTRGREVRPRRALALQLILQISWTPILGAAGFSEQWGEKHDVSDVFPNNLTCRCFRTFWLLWTSSMEAFYGFIMVFVFLMFDSQSPFASIVWEMTAMPVSCETPAEFCVLKKFHLTFTHHESEKMVTEFSFLGELILKTEMQNNAILAVIENVIYRD